MLINFYHFLLFIYLYLITQHVSIETFFIKNKT